MTGHRRQSGRSRVGRHLFSAGLVLFMGYVSVLFALGGCGSPQELAPTPTNRRGRMPEGVAAQLMKCARDGAARLRTVEHTINFNLHVYRGGRVGLVEIADSTLGDQDMEACMKDAFQLASWPAPVAAMQFFEPAPDATLSPHSRTLIGQGFAPPIVPGDAQKYALLIALIRATDGAITAVEGVGATVTAGAAAGGATIAAIGAGAAVFFYARPLNEGETAPQAKKPAASDEDPTPQPQGDPKTTGPTYPVPPEPPKPPKPKPRCDEVFPNVVNCLYIQQARYPDRKSALEAVIKSLPSDRQKRPFTTRGNRNAIQRPGVDHTTYWSADDRTKITIGCYNTCCKNTADGPVLEEGMKCYEHNTAYFR